MGASETAVPQAYALIKQATQDLENARVDRAIEGYNQVIMMDLPSKYVAAACLGRGNAYRVVGNGEKAMHDYEQAIRLDPTNPLAYMYRGLMLDLRDDPEGAVKDFTEALHFDPKMFRALYNRAGEYSRMGSTEAALRDLNEALRLEPKYALAYIRRGALFGQQHKWDKAASDYERAARLETTAPEPWLGLAAVNVAKRNYSLAVTNLEKALSIRLPRPEKALNQLAWLHATCPVSSVRNGGKAVEEALRACAQSTWSNPVTVDILAAAFAEAGQFSEAINYEWFAISLMPSDLAAESGAEQRLSLYQQRQPFRDRDPTDSWFWQRRKLDPNEANPPPSPVRGELARTL